MTLSQLGYSRRRHRRIRHVLKSFTTFFIIAVRAKHNTNNVRKHTQLQLCNRIYGACMSRHKGA